MIFSKITARQLIIWRVSEVFLIAALIFVVIILSSFIQDARRRISEKYVTLEQGLGGGEQTTKVKEELSQREQDINHILSFVPERHNLGEVVDVLERSAEQLGMTLVVPEIKEELKTDEQGNIITPTGPLREIRLRLLASGPPDKALRWLHETEYQPYLLTLVNWNFVTQKTVRVPPGAGMPVPPGELLNKPDTQGVSTITAEIIVSIRVNQEDE